LPAQKTSNQHEASASAIGYLFQSRLALLLGLRAIADFPNRQLSIEKLDDIAFEDSGSPAELIQTKHHLSKQGSLSDASEDMWKTLHIWTKLTAADSEVPFRTKFLLITTSPTTSGSAASSLRSYDRDEKKADQLLLKTAYGSKSSGNTNAYTAYVVLPEASRIALLQSITVLDSAPNILDVHDEICRFLRPAVPKSHLEHFVERLEGWWFGVVVRALAGTGPKEISIVSIENRIDELREDFHRNALPIDFSDATPPNDVVSSLDGRPFVRQLRDVEVGEKRIEYAIRDFYRASEQRSKWAREDLLVDGEIEKYQRSLIEAWQPRHAAMLDELPAESGPSEKAGAGRQIYTWAETEADFPLRGVRQRFLTQGSFQILANQKAIGWHPDFMKLCKTDMDGKDDE
jgi:hypothetical protein